MKKSIIITMFIMLLWGISVQAAPEAPVFSLNGGVYEEAIEVSLTGEGDIYYTLNGDVPTVESAKYEAPFILEPSDVTPPKGTTIRAAVIKDGETSYVSSNTYFIGTGIWDYVGNVPFVNLIATQYDLWDSSNGIYQNWSYEHKVPGVFHYITTDGVTEINRTIDMKVSGHGSRSQPKKSLRVYFKKTDPTQSKFLEYDLIPTAGVDYYSKVTFRISDYAATNLRDPLAQKIASFTRCDIARSVPMALFLNGEYWGLYECREQYDKDYLETHYGIDSDNIVFLDRDWTMPIDYTEYNGVTYIDKLEYSEGPEDDNEDGVLGETYYRTQWAYVKSLVLDNDFTSDEVYEEFCSVVDVDNLIDYMFVYMYAGNDDWPGNNMKFWRVTQEAIDPTVYGADGKWRFMIHDFDISFENAGHNTLYLSTMQKDANTQARHPKFATDLFEGLFKNEKFRTEFAQRSMVYLRTIASGMAIPQYVDELVSERTGAKQADLTRWNLGTLQNWINKTNALKSFAGTRGANMREQYMNVFNTYYDAGITGVVLFNKTGDECYINGAKVEGDRELKMFSGIPVTIKAPNCYIVAVGDRTAYMNFGELTLTPGTDYKLTIKKVEATIVKAEVKSDKLTAWVEIDDSLKNTASLYVAGYSEDDEVIFAKELDIDNPTLMVQSAKRYKLFLWDGVKPLCNSYNVYPQDADNSVKDPAEGDFDTENETIQ